MNIKGRHAFVTGSGKRLGRALAEELLRHGMNVTAHYRNSRNEAEDLAQWAQTHHLGTVFPVQADLTKIEEIESSVSIAIKTLGPVDLLINCASDFFPTPLTTVTSLQWDSLFELNLKAPFFLSQLCSEQMPSKGHILFIADVHGTKPIKKYAPYCATKAGLISLCKSLAKELAPRIRVNSLSPGTLLPPDDASAEEIKKAADRSLLGRVGEPKDLVQGMNFLLHNEYITGFDLIIDGGRSLV
jgi:NAD(P)-dependent dehydrogenase (short-subunit alcohol dehydrogenase family)